MKITIDLTRINKAKIEERTYANKEGVTVTQKLYSMDVVPLKESKVIKVGDGWKLVKTHFVTESATKEEREAKTKTPIIGDALAFEKTEDKAEPMKSLNEEYEQEMNISEDLIPF